MSKITNDGLTRSGTGRMLYSRTHMATVGVKGLTNCRWRLQPLHLFVRSDGKPEQHQHCAI